MKQQTTLEEYKDSLPCKDCIIFPICKNRYKHNIIGMIVLYISDLMRSCSVVKEWYNKEVSEISDGEKNGILRDCYKVSMTIEDIFYAD